MKLTKSEYQSIIDSRRVDLENAVATYRDNISIISDDHVIEQVKQIVKRAELLQEAYEAFLDADEEEQIAEYKESQNDSVESELAKVLSIRKEN